MIRSLALPVLTRLVTPCATLSQPVESRHFDIKPGQDFVGGLKSSLLD